MLQTERQACSAPGLHRRLTPGLHRRPDNREARSSGGPKQPVVAINYDKLQQFCTTFANGRGDHQLAMSEYPSLFIVPDKMMERPQHRPQHRPHTCNDLQRCTDSIPSHDIKDHVLAIRRELKVEDVVLIGARVKIILSVIKKPPVMRSDREVKKLAHHLEFFSNLFPIPDENISNAEFYTGLAQRATLEKLPGEGYAIAGRNGLHFILQGKIEKRSLVEDKRFIVTSTILCAGSSFGNIEASTEESAQFKWPAYPYYCTKSPCSLLNITATDYHRVIKICRKKFFEERQTLVSQCPILQRVSHLVTSQLTKRIVWETIPANTTIVKEGEEIVRIMFIKEGQCTATSKVATRSRSLRFSVGILGPKACIGEALIWNGTERHPYTIISLTNLVVGVIPCTSFEPHEIRKHISVHGRLSLPLLTEKQIRTRHARYLMNKQWLRLKDHVLEEVVTERGIEFDTKKWRHILSE